MNKLNDGLEFLESEFNLVQREKESKEVLYRITSGNMLVIQGENGSGKTALLKHAVDNFKGHGKVIYIDIRNLGKRFDVGKVLEGRGKGMILLVDNAHYLSESNNDKIKYFYDQNIIRSVIFTTNDFESINFTDSIKSRIGRNILELKELEKADFIEIAKARLGENFETFPEEVLEKLIKDSKNPKEFLTKCNLIRKTLVLEERNKANLEDLDNLEEIKFEDNSNKCHDCDQELVLIGKHWRCKSCDDFCQECGFLKEDDKECPSCGTKLQENKE
ncbi:MAG: hypothetical protein OQK82_01640 [Candidatus Pacearchaeota archaeon]|nr:hypothetical protein [Candidatus Pacearchaeota archaeon]